jgi:hypothetical protein
MSTHPEEDEVEDGEILDSESDDIIEEEDEEIDFDEEPDLIGLMTSLMATPEGDTVCSALVEISNQMQVQNKILIKILAKLQN